MSTRNATEVAAVDEDGTIHVYGPHDDSLGRAVREPGSLDVLRASGTVGRSAWEVEVLATGLLDGASDLVEPVDVTPPVV